MRKHQNKKEQWQEVDTFVRWSGKKERNRILTRGHTRQRVHTRHRVDLTWLGSPGNACSGKAECRRDTEFPPISSSLLFPAHSPQACWRNRPAQSSSLYGNICQRGWSGDEERCHRVKLTWMVGAKGNTHMKSLVIRWEPLAMDLNSTPSKLMSWGRHHSTMFPASYTQTSSWKSVPMWSFTLLNFLCKTGHGSHESQTASDNKKAMTCLLDFSTDHFHTDPDCASWFVYLL